MARRRTMGSRDHIVTYITESPNQEILLFYGGDANNGSPTYFTNNYAIEYIEDAETGEKIEIAHTYPEVNPEGNTNAGKVIKPGIYKTYSEAGEHKIKFRWKQNITTISNTFTNSNLYKIEPNIFYDCIKIEYMGSIFSNSKLSGIVPENIFANNKDLKYLYTIFGNTKIVGFSNNIFKNNSNLIEITYLFNQCRQIVHEITADLFKPLINIEKLSLFSDTPGVYYDNVTGVLSGQWFKTMTNLKQISGVLGINISGEIPEDLFKYNTKLETIGSFRSQSNPKLIDITGDVPQKLFANNPNLKSIRMFDYSKITALPLELFKYNEKLTRVGFIGCKNLQSIPSDLFKYTPLLDNLDSLFRYCSGLQGNIPEDLFINCPNITNLYGAFEGCSSLSGEIPLNLINHLTKLTTVIALFNGCSRLSIALNKSFFPTSIAQAFNSFGSVNVYGNITEDFFEGLSSVTSFSFDGNNITGDIPSNLLEPIKNTIQNIAFNSSGLTGNIPSSLFYGCINLTSANFKGCSSLTGNIPTGLFKDNPKLSNVGGLFNGCENLEGEIPNDLFSYCTDMKLNYIEAAFSNTRLTGAIPNNLFEKAIAISTFARVFYNSKITTIPDGLLDNLSNITNVDTAFGNCSLLTSISTKLFAKNKKITSFKSCFSGCLNLTGTVPIDDDGTPIYNRGGTSKEGYAVVSDTNSDNCFSGCTNLSDYDQIPDTWK